MCTLVCFCVLFHANYAQTYDKVFEQAQSAYASGDYETAIELSLSLMQMYEKMPALQVLAANAYRLNLQFNEARALYKQLAKTDAERYPEVLFWLAHIEQNFGNKKDAQFYYNRYITSHHREFYERTLNEVQKLQWTTETRNFNIVRDERSPFFHNYGVSLLHNSVVYNGVNVLENRRGEASHISFAPLAEPYKTLFSNPLYSFSDLQDVQGEIFVARRPAHTPLSKAELRVVSDSAGILTLQEPKSRLMPENQHESMIHVHFAHIGSRRVVFFAANMQGGFGGFDIWYCPMSQEGWWGTPINAGAGVNTAGDEMCPFFDTASKTLFFSSDWRMGMGGFDIFSAKYLHSAFQTAENMAVPINSSFDDFYYTILNDTAFFTSNRPQKKPEKTAFFYNSVFLYPLQTPLRHAAVDAASPTKRTDEQEFRTTLFFRHDFPQEQSVLNYAEEYAQYKDFVETQIATVRAKEFSIAQKIEEQQLRDFLSKQLVAHAEALRRKLQEIAQEKGEVVIELQAFTSASGSREYNERLAQRRTESVRNCIVEELQRAGIHTQNVRFYEKTPVILPEKPHTEYDFSIRTAHERVVEVRIFKGEWRMGTEN